MAGKKKEQPPVVKEALKTPYVKRMTKKGVPDLSGDRAK